VSPTPGGDEDTDYYKPSNMTEEQCKQECSGNERCKGFEYGHTVEESHPNYHCEIWVEELQLNDVLRPGDDNYTCYLRLSD
tara:strand:+ start:668 stop:910 length:243 start_codon:yes stop_codon:yes gene_type:complete